MACSSDARSDCATCLADSMGLKVPKPEDFHPNPHSLGRKSMSWALKSIPPSCSSSPGTTSALPGEITPSNLAPGIVLYPANEKQPNAIQPVPTSSCFQQKSPRNCPRAVQPQPWLAGSRWEPAGHLRSPRPPATSQPSLMSPAWQCSSQVSARARDPLE